MLMTKLKFTAVLLLAVGFAGAGGGWFTHRMVAQAPAPDEKRAVVPPGAKAPSGEPSVVKEKESKIAQVAPDQQLRDGPAQGSSPSDKLKATVEIGGFDDPNVTLQEGLEALTRLNNIRFRVNQRAFKYENVAEVLKTPIAEPDPIPKMKTSLANVLESILDRIPVRSGATILIRKDCIEITTGHWAAAELGLPLDSPLPPLVYEDFKDEPWLNAVRAIADRDFVSVVVDSQAVGKASHHSIRVSTDGLANGIDTTPPPNGTGPALARAATGPKEVRVTAQLHNIPVETAARVLAELADLGLARIDNVLYITTREKAARIEKEKPPQSRKMPGRPRVLAPPGEP